MTIAKKKTKPRLQPGALAKSITLSVIPADLRRFLTWMRLKGIETRSAGFRALLDAAGA